MSDDRGSRPPAWVFYVASVALGTGASLQGAGVLHLDTTALYMAVLALVALVLPKIKELSVGKDGVTFKTALEELKAGQSDLATAMLAGVGGRGARNAPALPPLAPARTVVPSLGGGSAPSVAALAPAAAAPAPAGSPGAAGGPAQSAGGTPLSPDDPHKGQFGGEPIAQGRRLSATVTASNVSPDLFRVLLKVESVDPKSALRGRVTFYLHPTFNPPVLTRPVLNGTAELELIAWGAFTVGAEIEGEPTRLELDLESLRDAPMEFRSR